MPPTSAMPGRSVPQMDYEFLSTRSEPAPEPEPEPEPSGPSRSTLAYTRSSAAAGAGRLTLCSLHSTTLAAHYAFLMAGHPRLGAASPAACLTADLLEYIVRLKQATDTDNAYLLLAGGMVRNAARLSESPRVPTGTSLRVAPLWSSTTVRAVHIPTGTWHAEPALPK